MEDYPPYPFQRIKRVTGKDTGVMAIIAPFYDLDYYKVKLERRHPACCLATNIQITPFYAMALKGSLSTTCEYAYHQNALWIYPVRAGG